MTRISFKRSGGILGREIEKDIDLNQIPDSEAQELMQLITDTNFFKIPQNLIGHATPDEYEYTVTVEAGNTNHTVHASDATAPAPFRLLLQKLSQLVKEDDPDSTTAQRG